MLCVYLVFEMNGALGYDFKLQSFTGLGTTRANEMDLGIKHAPGAGSLAQPVDLQSSVLPLCYGCSAIRA